MLHIAGLRKSYGGGQVALRSVDIDVDEGEIVALLGPNGAGKTTLVSIVAGLRRADAGVVEVAGIDALGRSREVRRYLGLAPQDTGIYPVVSVRQNLRLFGELSGLRRPELRRRVEEVAEALDITDLLDRQAGKLSGGQKRRVHTAIAFMHRPRLLLLDEATTGADVETRTHILELVQRLAGQGSSVLYSTHYLAEVSSLPATVAILDQGEVIARGGVRELVAAHAHPVVELSFHGVAPSLGHLTAQRVDGDRVRLPAPDPAAVLVDVLPTLPAGSLAGVEIIRPDLEAVYLALTGRRYHDADAAGAHKEGDRDVTEGSWAIMRHELRVMLSDPSTVVFVVLMPLFMVAIMKELFATALRAQGYPSANGSEFGVPAMAVAFAAFGVGYSGFTFFRDHGWGTWDRLRATPASAVDIMVGKVVPNVLLTVVQLMLLFTLGGPLFGLEVSGSWAALVVLILVLAVSLSAFGMLVTSLARTMNQLNAVGSVGGMALALLGGAWVPIETMPGWAQTIAPAIPTYWAMEGFSDVILESGSLGAVLVPSLVLLGFGALFTALSAWKFRFEDTKVYYG